MQASPTEFQMEERILGIEHTVEEIDSSLKENVASKNFLTQNVQEIRDHYEKTKPKNARNRRWRTSVQKPRKRI